MMARARLASKRARRSGGKAACHLPAGGEQQHLFRVDLAGAITATAATTGHTGLATEGILDLAHPGFGHEREDLRPRLRAGVGTLRDEVGEDGLRTQIVDALRGGGLREGPVVTSAEVDGRRVVEAQQLCPHLAVDRRLGGGASRPARRGGRDELQVLVPALPGDYELRYLLDQRRQLVTAQPLLDRFAAKIHAPYLVMAGVLVVVAWNMSEHGHFRHTLRSAPRGDKLVLLLTFGLTVFVDLTVAIEVGMVVAAFAFMHRMAGLVEVTSGVQLIEDDSNGESAADADQRRGRPCGQAFSHARQVLHGLVQLGLDRIGALDHRLIDRCVNKDLARCRMYRIV